MVEKRVSRTMATGTVRKLLFEDWWRDHIMPADGVEIPQRELYKAYCAKVEKRERLGPQAFESQLNGLRIKRKVKQGKTYRVGVTFTMRPASAATMQPAVDLPPPNVTLRKASSPMIAEGATPERGAAIMRPASKASADLARIPLDCVGVFEVGPGEDDLKSLAIAGELYEERRRHRAPTTEGGEGWSAEHDDGHGFDRALERAGCAYAFAAAQPDHVAAFLDMTGKPPRDGRLGWLILDFLRFVWPWEPGWWKPKTETAGWRRRCLVIAGSLIIAAIERIDRADTRDALEAQQRSQMTGV